MTNAMTEERFIELVADESIPFTHRLLWVLLREGELRLGDLLSMDVRDIDIESSTAFVEFPKEGVPKAVPLSANARVMLRFAIDGRSEGPLFTDSSGDPLTRDAAVRQAQAVGVSIHGFRLGGKRAG
ncbi:tyrosine-type recombinase/integrase [Streptomyces diastatochromogenes]|uniref:tyrosine-type recombinase/integrase n=1 Tax=Streptomyces diastatochromogenes TaxID=42236 RepID=UPI003655EDA6